ncbi:MAG TPA: hypothetical protein VFJ94_07545, partial [Intrasporangium sp.]|uniref:hypothetical protein n=1 Tax=Intrasporangium sp. TaxID=1925024 RepID=UPI002D7A3048
MTGRSRHVKRASTSARRLPACPAQEERPEEDAAWGGGGDEEEEEAERRPTAAYGGISRFPAHRTAPSVTGINRRVGRGSGPADRINWRISWR